MTISLTAVTRVARSTRVFTGGLGTGQELAMMHLEKNAYYTLDSIGAAIWNLLEESRTVEALCADLCERYDVSREQCQADVLAFLERAHDEKLVEIVAADAE